MYSICPHTIYVSTLHVLPMDMITGEFTLTGMFQKAMLMAMVQRSRLMQQETLWARVKGLRDGGSTTDTQMCSSLKPFDVRLWKIFLKRTMKIYKNHQTFNMRTV